MLTQCWWKNATRFEAVAVVEGVPAAALEYHTPGGRLLDAVVGETPSDEGGKVETGISAGDSRFRYVCIATFCILFIFNTALVALLFFPPRSNDFSDPERPGQSLHRVLEMSF